MRPVGREWGQNSLLPILFNVRRHDTTQLSVPGDVVQGQPRGDTLLQKRFRDTQVSQTRLLQVKSVAELLGSGLRVERMDVVGQLRINRLQTTTDTDTGVRGLATAA